MDINRPKSINRRMQNFINFMWLLIQAVIYSFMLIVILLLIYKAATYLLRLL